MKRRARRGRQCRSGARTGHRRRRAVGRRADPRARGRGARAGRLRQRQRRSRGRAERRVRRAGAGLDAARDGWPRRMPRPACRGPRHARADAHRAPRRPLSHQRPRRRRRRLPDQAVLLRRTARATARLRPPRAPRRDRGRGRPRDRRRAPDGQPRRRRDRAHRARVRPARRPGRARRAGRHPHQHPRRRLGRRRRPAQQRHRRPHRQAARQGRPALRPRHDPNRPRHRLPARGPPVNRLPLRVRLVAGFAVAMLVVLIGAGAFVFWRVQYALDHRLDQDLQTQSSDLRQAAAHLAPRAALASLRDQARETQLLTPSGAVLAAGPGAPADRALLTPEQSRRAARAPLRTGRGYLFSERGRHLRILAVPVPGRGTVAVSAVRLDQRDEALRELLAQLAIANLLALAIASVVGYRLARAALDPVERYRAQAEQITHGATGVRLDVPDGPRDEITRLGSTLNAMLDAQERATERQRQFVDDASHELCTPLATLSAEIDLALRKPRTAEEHEATLRRLAIDSTQLIELAETLLALGALGSTTPNAEDVSVADALNTAARRARSQLDPASSRAVEVEASSALTVHADHGLLERALGNLVDNAVRYGEGTITVTATPAEGLSTPVMVLTVHDEGRGIPPDFLEDAAERFRQDESSRTGPGAGLGLALVDAIV